MKKSGYEKAFVRLAMACGFALLNHAMAQEILPLDLGAEENDLPDLPTPNFSTPGGIYQAPFNLVLSCAPLGTSVIYTTDGTSPSLKNGTRAEVGKPVLLEIGRTTIVRAISVESQEMVSRSHTQSLKSALAMVTTP